MSEFRYLEAPSIERARICVLRSFSERLVGLLWARSAEEAPMVLLRRCSSVHTFGMAFDLDLGFIDCHGNVVRVERSVVPWRLVSSRRAESVIERAAREGPWLERGDRVRIVS